MNSVSSSSAFGEELSSDQVAQLCLYQSWLSTEASAAGALGPQEAPRIIDRHLNDSLAYARFLPRGSGPIFDLGSGAGLPGIPLAIAVPNSRIILSDRSQRRIDLLERAVRVLDLVNIEVIKRDLKSFVGEIDVAVARAVLQPDQWPDVAKSALNSGGILIVGVGEASQTPLSADGLVVVRHDLDPAVLDRQATFLTMQKRE